MRRGFFQRVIGSIQAVDGVDFDIEAGKTLGLVGESGCGKSTVSRLLIKLLETDEGKFIFHGQDVSGLSQSQMKPLRKEIIGPALKLTTIFIYLSLALLTMEL